MREAKKKRKENEGGGEGERVEAHLKQKMPAKRDLYTICKQAGLSREAGLSRQAGFAPTGQVGPVQLSLAWHRYFCLVFALREALNAVLDRENRIPPPSSPEPCDMAVLFFLITTTSRFQAWTPLPGSLAWHPTNLAKTCETTTNVTRPNNIRSNRKRPPRLAWAGERSRLGRGKSYEGSKSREHCYPPPPPPPSPSPRRWFCWGTLTVEATPGLHIIQWNIRKRASFNTFPRVINFKFPLRPHQKYNISQYEERGFSELPPMKDDYTTNSYYLTYTLRDWSEREAQPPFSPFSARSSTCSLQSRARSRISLAPVPHLLRTKRKGLRTV